MSRYNQKASVPAQRHPLTTVNTVAVKRTPTYEGAAGYARDAKTELFLRATGSFAGQKSFYESADKRDLRLVELTEKIAVTTDGWEWLCGFLPWLRGEGNMRTAPLLIAAEAVRARLDRNITSPVSLARPGVTRTEGQIRYEAPLSFILTHRQLLDAVMQRPDEPGELLAYWHAVHGRKIPQPVKRALADAATRLYTERSLLKYDTASHGVRFGDVLELAHPKPRGDTPWQGQLFKHAIDRRHGRGDEIPAELVTLLINRGIRRKVAEGDTSTLLDSEKLKHGGMTWEDALSLAGGSVPKDKLWEAMIPSLGYMALIRNLRNFDEAKVSNTVARKVANRIADPDEVARSRQMPFRFYSAYKNVTSLRWSQALEEALGYSLANVPEMDGRTLILVDRSPSMFPGYYFSTANTAQVTLADQAALFGSAVALRAENPTLVEFGGKSREIPVPKGGSVLRLMEQFKQIDGTDIPSAVVQHYKGHDRVLIVTDEQTRPGYLPSNMVNYGGRSEAQIDALIPTNVPVYMWNLAGYKNGAMPSGTNNRYTLGGLQDSTFRMVAQLEAVGRSTWPWESSAKA